MAKAIAICTCATCGNEFKSEKFCRNRTEADNWEKWAEEHFDECPDCYKKRKEDELKAEIAANSYPDLTGSPKQIAWAEKIRHGFLKDLKSEELTDTGRDFLKYLIQSRTESRFWIDHRNDSVVTLFENWLNA